MFEDGLPSGPADGQWGPAIGRPIAEGAHGLSTGAGWLGPAASLARQAVAMSSWSTATSPTPSRNAATTCRIQSGTSRHAAKAPRAGDPLAVQAASVAEG
jgi:hypothetical protein